MERRPLIGPRTGQDVLKDKVVRQLKDGTDVYDDYFTTDSEDESSSEISDDTSASPVKFQTQKSPNLAKVAQNKSPITKNVQSPTINKSNSKESFHDSIDSNVGNISQETSATFAEDVTVNMEIKNSSTISSSGTNSENYAKKNLSSKFCAVASVVNPQFQELDNSQSQPSNKKKELPTRKSRMSIRIISKKSISRSTKNPAEIKELQNYDEFDEKIMQMVYMNNNENNRMSVASGEELSMSQKLPLLKKMRSKGKTSENNKLKENIIQTRNGSCQLKENSSKIFLSKKHLASRRSYIEKATQNSDISQNSDKENSHSDSQVNPETEVNTSEPHEELTTVSDSYSVSNNCLESPMKSSKNANDIVSEDINLQTKSLRKRSGRSRNAVEINSSNIEDIRNITNSAIDDNPVVDVSASQEIVTRGKKSSKRFMPDPDKNNEAVDCDNSIETQIATRQSLTKKDLVNNSMSSENSVSNVSESNVTTSRHRTAMKKNFTLDKNNLETSNSNYETLSKENNLSNISCISAQNSDSSVSELNLKNTFKKRKKIQNTLLTDDSDDTSRLQTSGNKRKSITRRSSVQNSNNTANESMIQNAPQTDDFDDSDDPSRPRTSNNKRKSIAQTSSVQNGNNSANGSMIQNALQIDDSDDPSRLQTSDNKRKSITRSSSVQNNNSANVSMIQNALQTDDSDDPSRLQTSDNKRKSITRSSSVLNSNNSAIKSMKTKKAIKKSKKFKKNNSHNTAINKKNLIPDENLEDADHSVLSVQKSKSSSRKKKSSAHTKENQSSQHINSIHNTETNKKNLIPDENLEDADHNVLSVQKSKSSSRKKKSSAHTVENQSLQHSNSIHNTETNKKNLIPDENFEDVDIDVLSVQKSMSGSSKDNENSAHTEEENHAVRRSTRQRFAPLARWRNERLRYCFQDGEIKIKGIDKGTKEDTNFTKSLFKKFHRKKKEKILKPRMAKIFDVDENKEKRVTLLKKFPLIPWDLPVNAKKNKDFDNGFLMKRMFDTRKNSFGYLQINKGKTKPIQYMPEEDLHLAVVKGDLEICVHKDAFKVTTHDMFIVPHGTAYSIKNVGHNNALLSYAVGKFRFTSNV